MTKPLNSMIEQIQLELDSLKNCEGYGCAMHHIERAERQLIDLRIYVYQITHPINVVSDTGNIQDGVGETKWFAHY